MAPSHQKTNVIQCQGSILLSGRKDERKLFLSNTERSHVEPQQQAQKRAKPFYDRSRYSNFSPLDVKMKGFKNGEEKNRNHQKKQMAYVKFSQSFCNGRRVYPSNFPSYFYQKEILNKEKNDRNQQEAGKTQQIILQLMKIVRDFSVLFITKTKGIFFHGNSNGNFF